MANSDSVLIPAVLVTSAVMITYEFVPKDKGGEGQFPPVKLLLGLGVTTMGLALMGEIAPEVAKWLAIAIATTAVLYRGTPIAENYFGNSKESATK